MKTISNRIIRRMDPCYDPAEVVKDENEELPVKEWVAKYRDLVKDKSDIIWLLCNKLYMSERDMRLFAVWCAREALKLVDNPDPRSVEACNVAERYANGEATIEELNTAETAAWDTAEDTAEAAETAAQAAARAAAWAAWSATSTARSAARAAAWAAAWAAWSATSTARSAARAAAQVAWIATLDTFEDAQIDQLMTYF